jgi:hypothetical protein
MTPEHALSNRRAGHNATIDPPHVDQLMVSMRGQDPFNMARLQITGAGNENLFRRHLRDRPRETMPQLPTGFGEQGNTGNGRTMEEFEQYLHDKGVKFEYGSMDPRELIASQSELSGPKVSKLYGFMRDGGWLPTGVMIVARHGDNEWAVVDGHHRWAGAAAASIARGGTLDVNVLKIDADIDDVLGTPEHPDGVVMGFGTLESLAADRTAAETPHGAVMHDAEQSLTALRGGEQSTIDPSTVHGLMESIKSAAAPYKAKGEDPPPFNLANLQITGKGNENLFRRHLRDRPRETMPQLPTGFGEGGNTAKTPEAPNGRTMEEFEQHLRDKGVSFEYGMMDPRQLVASQSELNGFKVTKLYGFMEKDGWLPTGVMIVARNPDKPDEWVVVDGHHRWAGAAAASIARGGTMEVQVMYIDQDLDHVLGTDANPHGSVMDFGTFEGLGADRTAVPTEAAPAGLSTHEMLMELDRIGHTANQLRTFAAAHGIDLPAQLNHAGKNRLALYIAQLGTGRADIAKTLAALPNAKPRTDIFALAERVAAAKDAAAIDAELAGLTVADLRRLATEMNVQLPRGINGAEVRPYIVQSVHRDRGRWHWR